MSRFKKHIGINVLEAAKQRIHHIYDTHDTVAVCFSGGKDSQVVLHLTWEVAQERGEKYVNVIFHHDEFVMTDILKLVRNYASMPWVRMHHFVIPKPAVRYVFNKPVMYKMWDTSRELFMPIPDYAIRPPKELWDDMWTAEKIEDYLCGFFDGKLAQINGMRSSESRYRWRASVNKLIENYINYSSNKSTMNCKPIFDWEEKDVFKYLYDNKIQYCRLYDWQFFAKMGLRTSQPLHPEKIKELKKLRQIDPHFYDRLLQIFPDQEVHDRYGHDRDNSKIIEKYGNNGLAGVLEFINDYYPDEDLKAIALSRIYQLQQLMESDRNKAMNNYPIPYILKYFIAGNFQRLLLPYRKGQKAWKNLT